MKLLKITILAGAVALGASACGQNSTNTAVSNANTAKTVPTNTTPAATAVPDELAAVKKIYSEKCVRCHKEDGTGGETEIDGVKIKAPNFTSDKLKNEPDKEFIDAIENGFKDDGMPAFKGKIPDQDIKDLVKLIRRDFQKK